MTSKITSLKPRGTCSIHTMDMDMPSMGMHMWTISGISGEKKHFKFHFLKHLQKSKTRSGERS